MAAGRLDVLLGLDAARFVTGLNQASREANKFESQMLGLGAKIGAAIGGALSAGAFVSLVKGAIDAADRLNDLSKQTGVAVETLGGLGFAASQAGGDLESTVEGLGKLNKTIAEAAAGNEKAGEFFQKLGIDVRDSNKQIKDAGAVYVEVADKFAQFEDGPNKAALALRGFGKAGQAQIPILNEGGKALQANIDYYKKFSGVTAETARQADEFNDTMGKLGLLARSLGQKIAIELLPFLQTLGNEFQKVGEDGGSAFDTIAQGFSNFFRNFTILAVNVKYVLTTLGKDITERASQLKAFFSGDFAKAGEIGDAIRARGEEARKEVDRLTRAIAESVPQKPVRGIGLEDLDAAARRARPGRPAPGLRDSGAASEASALAKKQLAAAKEQRDAFFKESERAIDFENELLSARNRFLELYNSQGLVSIKDFYDARRTIIDEATAETVRQYQVQIAAEKEFQAFIASQVTAKTKAPDRIEAETKIRESQGKINELLDKQAKVTREASAATLELGINQQNATAQYTRDIQLLNAQVLELTGNLRGAAEIRLQGQITQQRQQFQGNPEAQAQIDIVEKLTRAQTEYNISQNESRQVIEFLNIQEDRLALSREKGNITEIEMLQQVGRQRALAVSQMRAQVEAQEAIARASGNQDLILNAQRARVEFERLAAAVDPLAEKFQGIYKDAFSDAFSGLLDDITAGESALDSFKKAFGSFVNDITRQINRMAAQSITDALFGSTQKGSGSLAGFIGSLFGGSQDVSGVFASGTDFVPRDGLAYLHRGERVVTAQENRGGWSGNVNNTFVIEGNISKQTQQQLANEVGRSVASSRRRIG